MNKYISHRTEITPKQGWIKVIEQIFESNRPNYNKRRLQEKVIKIVDISNIEIPIEEYESKTEHFDNRAFQSDDRFFTTTETKRRYNVSVCNELCKQALGELNKEPILYN